MKIAVIGGGAAGMTTAYLLDKNNHQVTLYEKEPMLGGNIRTLNWNVDKPEFEPGLVLEAGVIEFSSNFHNFLNLMRELDVAVEPVEVGSALFLRDGRSFLSPNMIRANIQGVQRIVEQLRFSRIQLGSMGLHLKRLCMPREELQAQSLSDFMNEERLGDLWLILLMMYSYSIRFDQAGEIPADLAMFALQSYMAHGWYRLPGGVYSYMERMQERFGGELRLGTRIDSIRRSSDGAVVQLEGASEQYDKVVFATPPDQVLKLLADPSPDESRRFAAWQANIAETVVHSDASLYHRYDIREMSEFDFFETSSGWGYNCYLNRICGLDADTHYFLAFDLDELVDERKVLHRQRHHTPFYTVEALRYRDEVLDHNGQNHTYHVGAYLADGLHEGAVSTAMRTALLIGR